MKACLVVFTAALAAFLQSTVEAQTFPNRPVRLISPFAPGGGNDIVSRGLAQAMSPGLGQPVIVENKPGANTIVGLDFVAKSAPDGYTVAMASSSHTINASLYKSLPYDSIKDFSAVSIVALTPYIVATYPGLEVSSVKELVALAKAKPGQLSYPSAGTGNPTHLSVELFASMAGVNLLHVPYKGSGPAIADLLAGRHALTINTAPSVLSHIRSGKLRAIAITTSERSPSMPDLPTVAESGLPGYEVSSWYGVLGPARIPRATITRLRSEIVAALGTAELKKLLETQNLTAVGNTPEQFAAIIQSDVLKWEKVVKATGATAE